MSIEFADVIVDLQSGDTGKGKVAHHLAQSGTYNCVLRYNGGSNAGHTVYHAGKKIVTHQVPIGVLYGIKSIIGVGCVVNVPALLREIKELNFAGINTDGLIFVDKRAHVVLSEHLEEDGSDTKIGTTRQGIGPAYRDKYGRIGTRIGDESYSNIAKELVSNEFQIIDTYKLFFSDSEQYRILCEGAQGFNLDIDWGDYPYVTSSHCTVGSVCLNGIPPQKIRKVFGVLKAYETYVGNKEIAVSDFDAPIFERIQEVGNEFGATTGRKRRVNWLNLPEVIKAMHINGVTNVIINKADVLEEVGQFAIIANDGKSIRFSNIEVFEQFVNETLMYYSIYDIDIKWSKTPYGI
jgi:adenylosuccinate synthase